MTVLQEELSSTQLVGNMFDAIIGRLSYDEEFAKQLAQDTNETLDRFGLHMEKEAIEAFMKNDPVRFDKICDRLAELVDPDTLARHTEPSCG